MTINKKADVTKLEESSATEFTFDEY